MVGIVQRAQDPATACIALKLKQKPSPQRGLIYPR